LEIPETFISGLFFWVFQLDMRHVIASTVPTVCALYCCHCYHFHCMLHHCLLDGICSVIRCCCEWEDTFSHIWHGKSETRANLCSTEWSKVGGRPRERSSQCHLSAESPRYSLV